MEGYIIMNLKIGMNILKNYLAMVIKDEGKSYISILIIFKF